MEQLRVSAGTQSSGAAHVEASVMDSAFQQFRRSFDSRLGGFGGAPKFPRPSVHNFLLRYWKRTGNEEALDMVATTLIAMEKGGMNDQLGGGFHRYSVDEYWFVPHFEKMLYDQAQLVISYLEAFQITGERRDGARCPADARLRDARHDGARRRLLVGRRCRQRRRSREAQRKERRRVLHLDVGRSCRAAGRRAGRAGSLPATAWSAAATCATIRTTNSAAATSCSRRQKDAASVR